MQDAAEGSGGGLFQTCVVIVEPSVTATSRSVTSLTTSNLRLNFCLVISTLRVLGHGLIVLSKKPAAAQQGLVAVKSNCHFSRRFPMAELPAISRARNKADVSSAMNGPSGAGSLTYGVAKTPPSI